MNSTTEISPAEIVRCIAEKVCPLLPKRRNGAQDCRRALTNALNLGLRNMTDEGRIIVRYEATRGKRNDPNGEFLWDHVWIERQDGRLLLVLESEWSQWPELVMNDFRKLLYARSALKVLVYSEQTTSRSVHSDIDKCITAFPYHSVAERYLIVNLRGWISGCIEAWLYETENDLAFGVKLTGPSLVPLD